MTLPPPLFKIATRASRLALAQAEEARRAMVEQNPGWLLDLVPMTSPGDRDQQTSLTDPKTPDDFFTRDLDDAVLAGEADMAVHSAKDLPRTHREGLVTAALLPARDIRDALVVRSGVPSHSVRVIGTSSPARIDVVATLYPEAVTRAIRGSIDQRLAQLDAGTYDAVIVAACALERLGLADRISRYLPYDPAPQQGRLALVTRADRIDLILALRPLDVRRTAGLVAIVGCPADAELLSARAHSYLEEADSVIHDRLLPDGILAWIQHKAIAVGKVGGQPSTPQSEIHRQLLHEAEKGKLVVRLQGGDPLIFAHLSEQLAFLAAWNVRVDLVPTLTAAQVAAAHALAPLTHRQDGGHVHLLSGHPAKGEQPAPFPGPGEGNLAIYMSVSNADSTVQRLLEAGWPAATNVVIGERLGYRDEAVRHVSLNALSSVRLQRPAVFLVGPQTHLPTARTLFVGNDPEHFLKFGPLIHWPLIHLVMRPLAERCEKLATQLPQVVGVIFPSRFAVHACLQALLEQGDIRGLAGKKLLAVGPATRKELTQYGLHADAFVDGYGGLQALTAQLHDDWRGTYLYPCSSVAPLDRRRETLQQAGLKVIAETFYDNQPAPFRPLPDRPFDRVLFTSTSTVRAYFDNYPEEVKKQRVWLSVGPSTTRALQELNLNVEEIVSAVEKRNTAG